MNHDDLWRRFAEESPEQTCCRTGLEYDPDLGLFTMAVLDKTLAFDVAAQRIVELGPDSCQLEEPPHLALQNAATVYLLSVREGPASLEWVSPLELPAGEAFFRGPHGVPTEGLEAAFGGSPAKFREASEGLGGRPLGYADAAYQFDVFPRLGMAVLVWAADDEFPARARFLLDRSIASQMPLDALLGLMGLLADRLICGA